ncbi:MULTISPECIES: flavin reductase family protein [unclassified Streptomyces]|uniref:flavin reductase family protein n=1 Tax=unclassified Streptomyces TaxID=2593676 RepID=UPI00137085D4|nr:MULTISPECIES: flavin reductase family protein [unclassified Streptomyces]MCW5251415.1 flavin reductase [Streptomyces sp. SHP 1-2]MYU22516.1 flavin reductase [Streptomyces sp. SID8352]
MTTDPRPLTPAPDRPAPPAADRTAPGPDAMRRVCGHFTTGVTVVTADTGDGWTGATVNSFTSVSLDPPLVLFCLRHDSRLLHAVRTRGRFAVSILAAAQSATALRFAARGRPSFDGLDCLTTTTGAPVLRDSVAYLECALADEHPGGDHRIVVGAVTALGLLGPGTAAGHDGPLTFYRGRLARLDKECER